MGTGSILGRGSLAHVDRYVPGKPIEEVERELGLSRVVKLASNENAYGCSPKAVAAMTEEMARIPLYPESSSPALARKLAAKLGVREDQLFFGNGSDEIISLLARAFLEPGDEVVMADPTFSRYEQNVAIEGGVAVKVPCRDGVHDLDAMLGALTSKTKLVFVCNPNNPTGTTVGAEPLRAFIERVPSDVVLVVDEAYYEYVTAEDYLQTLPILDTHPNLVVLRTFSKIYGLAGLRIGYAALHPDVASILHKVRGPFNTSRLAQVAALASLDDPDFVAMCRAQNAAERDRVARALSDMGLFVYPSQTNFLLFEVPGTGAAVAERLLHQGVIVRAGEGLGVPGTVRVSLGTPEENDVFLQALVQSLN
ncbi:histidinol-phosphate aminotransferase [Alicyclobacillus vulcanalis]|uniref:Histidinol-phosphate aminotransferase n=1 Tax=Alicyclobacillus vulcanalis TaxID=252246 RepID=A0A1N7N8P3_9BACL|nr:histidinol-phosphate aminotransferase [Alicyclobacillus vulcanalis]